MDIRAFIMENPFSNLNGIEGLLIFLNHPLREPKLNGILKEQYERLFKEAWKETKLPQSKKDPLKKFEYISNRS